MSDDETRGGTPDSKVTSGAKRTGPYKPEPPKRGQFKPGQSGNPGGKSKGLAEIRQEFMKDVPLVMRRLLTLIVREKGAVAVAAAREFLDRTCGKAPQPLVGEDGGAPININAPALVEALRRYVGEKDDNDEPGVVTPEAGKETP